MGHGVYGLGVDVGDATVVAAICRTGEEGTSPRVLHLGGADPAVPATVRLDGEGRVLPFTDPEGGSPEGTVLAAHALSRVGGPSPYSAGSAAVPATEVLTALVRWVCARATEQEGERPASVVLVVPPFWAEHRRALLADAVACGVDLPCAVVSGAEAVVRAHAETGRLSGGSVVAVYDLGASTLDTAVVEIDAGGIADHRTAPRPPLPWGGRDIDDMVLDHVLESLRPVRHGRRPNLSAQLARALRTHCVHAKESLSTETVVRLPIDLPGSDLSFLRLTRAELEELVADPLAHSVEALRAAARDAGVDVADLDAVVLAGGGTRLPLVTETLSAELERPVVVDDEPELTGARGAALLALALLDDGDAGDPGHDGVTAESEAADPPAADSAPSAGAGRTRVVSRGGTSAGVRRPPNSQQSAAAAGRRRRSRQGIVVVGAVGTLLILPTAQLGTVAGDSIGLSADQRAQAAEGWLPPAAPSATPGESAAPVAPAGESAAVSARGAEQLAQPARTGASPAPSVRASDAAAAAAGGTPTAAQFAGAVAAGTAGGAAADPAQPATGDTGTTETPQGTGTPSSAPPSTPAPSTTTPDPTPPADTTPDPTPPADTTPDPEPPPDTTPDPEPPPDTTPDPEPPADAAMEMPIEPEPPAPPEGPGPTETA